MARHDTDPPATLSIIDRLIDEEPKKSTEPSLSRAQSIRILKASLKRDLEWLLNSRRNPDLEEANHKDAERSVFGYGLPDITAFGLSSTIDQKRLRRAIEQAIAVFEPRIAGARVQMEVLPSTSRGIRFHIQGLLKMDPSPEPISFDTVLELPSGQYEVKGN
jgi:type VI secretion system protein ImpF